MTRPGDEDLVLTVGPVAHGGHFVARTADGQVVFVRHALPGETVRVQVTGDEGRFLRADAVEVLEGSPHRVVAPCPLARPDGCGGCDFQHVDLAHQRTLKAAVVQEQLRRLAGLDRAVEVEEVPPTTHWRTRMQYVPLPDGRRGLRKHGSHEVVPVEECLIAAPDAREPGEGTVVERVGPYRFRVAAGGFWQVHPEAPGVLVDAVLGMLRPRPGERSLDLFSGVGLFSAFLAGHGPVVAVEGDRRAASYAEGNLEGMPARVVHGPVDRVLRRGLDGAFDLVVLDPPRAGARRQVVEAVARLAPRAVAYVACDPAALARDVGYFVQQGYGLRELRAFDLFPMTHHVECVALLTKTSPDLL
ncbi:MAG TPA: TRAM domain-containing protein [Marmoricola sp.]|nr:TRAM domain-containing protein [Marmoricola sp.]